MLPSPAVEWSMGIPPYWLLWVLVAFFETSRSLQLVIKHRRVCSAVTGRMLWYSDVKRVSNEDFEVDQFSKAVFRCRSWFIKVVKGRMHQMLRRQLYEKLGPIVNRVSEVVMKAGISNCRQCVLHILDDRFQLIIRSIERSRKDMYCISIFGSLLRVLRMLFLTPREFSCAVGASSSSRFADNQYHRLPTTTSHARRLPRPQSMYF